jgi:hypothetical protein
LGERGLASVGSASSSSVKASATTGSPAKPARPKRKTARCFRGDVRDEELDRRRERDAGGAAKRSACERARRGRRALIEGGHPLPLFEAG